MPSATETDKSSRKTIGGRAKDDEIRVIDLAAAIRSTTRGEFMVEAAYTAAIRVLEEQAPQLLKSPVTAS